MWCRLKWYAKVSNAVREPIKSRKNCPNHSVGDALSTASCQRRLARRVHSDSKYFLCCSSYRKITWKYIRVIEILLIFIALTEEIKIQLLAILHYHFFRKIMSYNTYFSSAGWGEHAKHLFLGSGDVDAILNCRRQIG